MTLSMPNLFAASESRADCAARGDFPAESWRAAWQALAPRLVLFARQWATSAADAEDLVQDAFIRCWRRLGERVQEEPALLFSAVRSAALDTARSARRRSRREELSAQDAPTAYAFECPVETGERARALEQALDRLPAEQREVVTLRIWGDLSFPEIATVLGIPADTAASRHRYALALLRRVLSPLADSTPR